ncbi:hypothetical protein LDVICp093 [lymphocystis disease virus-China]|uniref:Uncharacterized protein n=2 Tax=Lymphocystis disease virus 2 TaxID=159183 RepID=A0A6F8X147_9VIRU|nr:hypothetical protein LDVICp093 [lymphocystis disease virus-China]AAU10938.1 hypothetical protein [lymphocystis disease virus-China]BCB67465.1 hypothetical protein [Lymphocystis disease virus 2]
MNSNNFKFVDDSMEVDLSNPYAPKYQIIYHKPQVQIEDIEMTEPLPLFKPARQLIISTPKKRSLRPFEFTGRQGVINKISLKEPHVSPAAKVEDTESIYYLSSDESEVDYDSDLNDNKFLSTNFSQVAK